MARHNGRRLPANRDRRIANVHQNQLIRRDAATSDSIAMRDLLLIFRLFRAQISKMVPNKILRDIGQETGRLTSLHATAKLVAAPMRRLPGDLDALYHRYALEIILRIPRNILC